MSSDRWSILPIGLAAALCVTASVPLKAQPQPVASTTESQDAGDLATLTAEVERLQRAVDALQIELTESRRQFAALQQMLQQLREELAEERELLASQVAGFEQTKVESGSKYRVRVFGMLLLQLASTRGAVDNIDLPLLAIESVPGDSGANISAAVRQSQFGFAVFGPPLRGMATSGDVRFDLFGGFPDATDGLSTPSIRLRTMTFAGEGQRYSLRGGQEAPFFSPLSPTSLAASAYPAFSSSGNIWAWTPQVYLERRFERSERETVTLRAGVLDALTGELPAGEYSRFATAGERSRLPASAVRLGWRRSTAGQVSPEAHVLSVGGGGYYARHNWGFERMVHAWALTGDWEVPVLPDVLLSGEAYVGRAIGGLGGGAHSSVLFDGAPADPASTVFPMRSTGGWTQLKLTVTPRLELNLASGFDRSRPQPFQGLLQPPSEEPPSASRNVTGLANVIYQARSNLFFSVEYRRLWTNRLDGRGWLADHLNLGGGIAF